MNSHFRRRRLPVRLATVVASTAIASMLLLAGCSSTTPEREPGADGNISVKFAYYPVLVFLSSFIGVEKGIYAEHGLDVELIAPADAPTQVRMVMSGDLDGTIYGLSGWQNVAAQGQEVKLIGSTINRGMFQLVVPDAPWADFDASLDDKLRSLEGQTVGVPGIGSAADTIFRALLTEAGMDPDSDLTIIQMTDPTAALAQLDNNAIGGFIYLPPWPTVYELQGIARTYIDFGKDVPEEVGAVSTGTMGVSAAWLAENEEAAQRWIDAEAASIAWIMDPANKDELIGLIAKEMTNNDEAVASAVLDYMLTDVYPATEPDLRLTKQVFDNQLNLLVDAGTIPSGVVSYDDMVVTLP